MGALGSMLLAVLSLRFPGTAGIVESEKWTVGRWKRDKYRMGGSMGAGAGLHLQLLTSHHILTVRTVQFTAGCAAKMMAVPTTSSYLCQAEAKPNRRPGIVAGRR